MKNIIFYCLLFVTTIGNAQKTYTQTLKLMGSRFDITVVAENETQGNEYIQLAIEEIQRIERLISSWNPKSNTSLINKNAGIKPVKTSPELIGLIERCTKISQITDGAFDITYASMDKIWKFDGSVTEMPSPEKVKASVSKVGYQNIVIDKQNQTVFLKKVGMKIGFGAVGKGYAADVAKKLLINKGVKAGIINASGDMNTWGTQPNGDFWEVAITNPKDKTKAFGMLPIHNNAVVTSGNYEKFILINGKIYTHIIDPRTGYPAHGLSSVTIFAPKAELADALATSVFVMGKEIGINRINQIPNVECIIVDDEGNLHKSNNILFNKL